MATPSSTNSSRRLLQVRFVMLALVVSLIMPVSAEITMMVMSPKQSSFNNTYIVCILTVSLYMVKRFLTTSKAKIGKALPNPGGIPWVGPVWDIDGAAIYNTFKGWADRLGPLYEVKIFGQNLIIVSDPEIARDLLASSAKSTSDRPSIPLIDGSKVSGKYLPFLGNNAVLARQRRFGVMINTYTARQNYHGRFQPEAIRFLHQLLNKSDEPFVLLEQLCRRLSSRMAYGITGEGAAITKSAHNLMKNLSPGGSISNTLKFLNYIPTFMHPERKDEARRVDIEERVWKGAFYTAKAAYEQGTLRDSYAKFYFDQPEYCGLDELEAVYGIGMMATVSVLTITAPMQKWLIAMCENPKWQSIVQEELNERLGDRLANVNDIPVLPKLRATIVEALRWASPIPTGIPHRLETDMDYKGYHLSQDSNIIACDWAISRSSQLYKDAEIFDPSRYLDPNSPLFKLPLTEYPKPQGQTVFGYGRRSCIGQDYVTAQMVVVCAAILYAFDITKGIDPKTGKQVEIDVMKATPHVIPIMDSVDLRFNVRDAQKAATLRTMYQDIEVEE